MRLEGFSLRDFKSFEKIDLRPDPRVNVLVGDNAQGKTNFLEGIYYLCALRSFRPLKDRELVRFGRERAEIAADILSGGETYRMEVSVSALSRRDVRINGLRLRKSSEMLGNLNCVLFSPEDLMLVKGGSALRRRFVNLSLSQLRPRYFDLLVEYNRLLVRKSRMLKDLESKPSLFEALEAYNARFAEVGGGIISYREGFVRKLGEKASAIHAGLAAGERLELGYLAHEGLIEAGISEREAASKLLTLLSENIRVECRAKTCLYGPHRDDLSVLLEGNPAKSFASQGQTRTAALSLKLAERDIFYDDRGEYPVLLLDDLLSELDRYRQEYILKNIGQGQVFITCCDLNERIGALAGRVWNIKNSRLDG